MKWRESTGILCNKKVPLKVKGKFHNTVVRLATMYGSVCWMTNKKNEIKLKVAEMRKLRLLCVVTRSDRIRNEYIIGSIGVTNITKKNDRESIEMV